MRSCVEFRMAEEWTAMHSATAIRYRAARHVAYSERMA